MNKVALFILLGLSCTLYAGDHCYMAAPTLAAKDFKAMVAINDNRLMVTLKNESGHPYFLDLTTSYVQIPRVNWTSMLTDNYAGNPPQPTSIFPPGMTTTTFYAIASIKETDQEYHDVKFRWPVAGTFAMKVSLQLAGPDGVKSEYIFEGEFGTSPPKSTKTLK